MRGRVRTRVTALAVLLVLAVLTVAAVGLVVAQRRLLIDNLDDATARRADDLAALVAADRLPDRLPGGGDDIVAQVVDEDGTVLAASPGIT